MSEQGGTAVVDTKGWNRAIAKLVRSVTPARVITVLKDAAADVALIQLNAVRDRARTFGPPLPAIARSIRATTPEVVGPMDVRFTIGSPHPGARIQHYGGIIRAGSTHPDNVALRKFPGKKVSWLTIPQDIAKGTRARDYPGAFVLKCRDGKAYLVDKPVRAVYTTKTGGRAGWAYLGRGKNKRVAQKNATSQESLRFLFLLVKQVTIHPHPYMMWTAAEGQQAVDAVHHFMYRHFHEEWVGGQG